MLVIRPTSTPLPQKVINVHKSISKPEIYLRYDTYRTMFRTVHWNSNLKRTSLHKCKHFVQKKEKSNKICFHSSATAIVYNAFTIIRRVSVLTTSSFLCRISNSKWYKSECLLDLIIPGDVHLCNERGCGLRRSTTYMRYAQFN